MTYQQKSMGTNFRRPLVNWKALAFVGLGFVLYPVFTFFADPLFRHQARAGKTATYDSQRQQRELLCDDTWLFLQRTETSHINVQTIELHRLGCGDVRVPVRKGDGYANYVSRDPSFVLPEQVPTFREAMPQRIRTGRIAETTIGRDLKTLPSE